MTVYSVANDTYRVPYLDPSFEALVKIQLRFCAEAYSRMAQVQQYVFIRLGSVYRSRTYMCGIGIWTHQQEISTLPAT